MSARTVTSELLHDLVSGSHAEGITNLAVECAIVHEDRLLLLVEPGPDLMEDTVQLPQGAVLPGEALDDAVCRTLAAVGVNIEEMIGYVGHHDCCEGGEIFRVFCFALTVTDPDSPCRFCTFPHQWADLADLPGLPLRSELSVASLPTTTPGPRKSPSPSLAESLLSGASGLYAVEAGTQLLINHASWLSRGDFHERFVHRCLRDSTFGEIAVVDWLGAISALDAGELPCSGGEERMLRLAASLAHGIAVDLRNALIGLDAANIELVSQAVLHVSGP